MAAPRLGELGISYLRPLPKVRLKRAPLPGGAHQTKDIPPNHFIFLIVKAKIIGCRTKEGVGRKKDSPADAAPQVGNEFKKIYYRGLADSYKEEGEGIMSPKRLVTTGLRGL